MHPVVGVAAAYVLGSIPWAYLAGRLLKGIDLREHGSGNLGATNVGRVLGLPAAVAVLLLDFMKGAIPVVMFPATFGVAAGGTWAMLYGLAAIAGHVWSVFLLFKGGGKGVATAAGVFAALAWGPFSIAFFAFAITLSVTRYMSLGSLAGALALPIAMAASRGLVDPLVAASAVVCVFVFWTHRSNIERLRAGTELRLGQRGTGGETGA